MFFRSRKTPAQPTLEQQAASANQSAVSYLGVFANAANGLERAAEALDAIRDTAHDEALRHLGIKTEAHDAAFKHRRQAQKIRELVGETPVL